MPATAGRIVLPLVCLAVLAGVVFLRGKDEAVPERPPPADMAGPGYLPEGAPLQAPAAPPPRKGAEAVDFDMLAGFDYDPEADVIPDEITALDGRLVELRGVMYYAVADPGNVTEFYLMPNHMICCFGTPRLNEAVEVVLRPRTRTRYLLNYYLVRGTLEVGAVRDEEDRVLCLYRITDAEVEVME